MELYWESVKEKFERIGERPLRSLSFTVGSDRGNQGQKEKNRSVRPQIKSTELNMAEMGKELKVSSKG